MATITASFTPTPDDINNIGVVNYQIQGFTEWSVGDSDGPLKNYEICVWLYTPGSIPNKFSTGIFRDDGFWSHSRKVYSHNENGKTGSIHIPKIVLQYHGEFEICVVAYYSHLSSLTPETYFTEYGELVHHTHYTASDLSMPTINSVTITPELIIKGLTVVTVSWDVSVAQHVILSYIIGPEFTVSSPALQGSKTLTLNTIGERDVTIVVQDSRGNQTHTTLHVNVIDYHTPTISSFSVVRCTVDGAESDVGTYFKLKASYNVSEASKTHVCQYTLNAQDTPTVLTLVQDQWTSPLGAGELNADNTYTVQFSVIDEYDGIAIRTATLPAQSCYLDIYEDAVSFGAPAETNNKFEVHMPVQIGNIANSNLQIVDNAIQALFNGTSDSLSLNPDGGDVLVNGKSILPAVEVLECDREGAYFLKFANGLGVYFFSGFVACPRAGQEGYDYNRQIVLNYPISFKTISGNTYPSGYISRDPTYVCVTVSDAHDGVTIEPMVWKPSLYSTRCCIPYTNTNTDTDIQYAAIMALVVGMWK